MARMHSRAKGKSKSTKPAQTQTPAWVSYQPKEVELLIAKLGKEGKTASTIGITLRDTYGIPSVQALINKTITQVLKEKKLTHEVPEDLRALIRKDVAIRKHFEENKQDRTALRGQQLTLSKINRLVKYYKNKNILPAEWKYDASKATLYLE